MTPCAFESEGAAWKWQQDAAEMEAVGPPGEATVHRAQRTIRAGPSMPHGRLLAARGAV